MRFPPDILDEIRARLPVSAVVSRKVPLKKQGRELAGLSPFKTEKT
ncbi:MAG: CHC2 zinc finger domain-containing protein, partial [Pseudomonadota bacterium]